MRRVPPAGACEGFHGLLQGKAWHREPRSPLRSLRIRELDPLRSSTKVMSTLLPGKGTLRPPGPAFQASKASFLPWPPFCTTWGGIFHSGLLLTDFPCVSTTSCPSSQILPTAIQSKNHCAYFTGDGGNQPPDPMALDSLLPTGAGADPIALGSLADSSQTRSGWSRTHDDLPVWSLFLNIDRSLRVKE